MSTSKPISGSVIGSHVGSDNGSEAESPDGSHVLTYERTDGEASKGPGTSNGPRSANDPENQPHPATIRTAYLPTIDQLEAGAYRKRWEILRRGDREPISWLLRLSVYRRDGYTCRQCGYIAPEKDVHHLQLDHRIPWSANGPDDSDNLRVLCRPCNERRSNYIDQAHESHIRPTTWWCIYCWTAESENHHPMWKDGTDLGFAPRVEEPTTQAFCAWCMDYSHTDLPLIGETLKLVEAICYAKPSPLDSGDV